MQLAPRPCVSQHAFQSGPCRTAVPRVGRPSRGLRVVAQASSTDDVGAAGLAAIAVGLVSNPVVALSLYTLKTTGAGLPPGPGGLYGAIEGISFLGVYGIAAWSIYTKVKTGSGLPAGPSGLLGAVEGISFLTVLASFVVFGLEFADKGALPGITG